MGTLDSRIDVGQGINIGHGKFNKKNKYRALKFGKNLRSFVMKKQRKLFLPFLILNLINVGPFNKAVGPGKKSKINKRRAYVYSGV